MNDDQLRANGIAQMNGGPNWISTLLLKEETCVLNKREFYDAIYVRCSCEINFLLIDCVCGKLFSLDQTKPCRKVRYDATKLSTRCNGSMLKET